MHLFWKACRSWCGLRKERTGSPVRAPSQVWVCLRLVAQIFNLSVSVDLVAGRDDFSDVVAAKEALKRRKRRAPRCEAGRAVAAAPPCPKQVGCASAQPHPIGRAAAHLPTLRLSRRDALLGSESEGLTGLLELAPRAVKRTATKSKIPPSGTSRIPSPGSPA